jgi:acyl dehydratase
MKQTDQRPGWRDYPQKYWQQVEDGEQLPGLELPIDYKRIVLNAASTWDWFPGHHNPEYARAQGQENIYASTILFHGVVDRLVTDWAGPRAFIVRRGIRMQQSVYPGDTLSAQGQVTRRYRDDAGSALVDIEIELRTERGVCVPATVTARLPEQGDVE